MRIVHFADLHLGVESYGRVDPATGLPSRLLDFLAALDQVVDYAIDQRVDLVVFCGDAYKSRDPTPTQQREFARRIKYLSQSNIPIFVLIGNHDLPNAAGRATTTEIFDTLEVSNVYVSGQPDVHRILTRSGTVQVASLPWLRRSALLGREETKNLNFSQINEKLQQVLTDIITAHVARLDPNLPAILAAHVWVAGATTGSERQMSIGQEHVVLKSNAANPAFDYVALGHIHKHQVLSENPPVVYSGSLERVDFGEEGDDKGFCLVDIETTGPGKRQVSHSFHPVKCRDFLTIDVSVKEGDAMSAVLSAIAGYRARIRDAIVRLGISLPAELEAQVRDTEIRDALREASYLTISRNVVRQSRLRLSVGAEQITPPGALKAYLESKKVPLERAELLIRYSETLLQE